MSVRLNVLYERKRIYGAAMQSTKHYSMTQCCTFITMNFLCHSCIIAWIEIACAIMVRNGQHIYIYLPKCCIEVNTYYYIPLTKYTNNTNVPDVLFWTQSQFDSLILFGFHNWISLPTTNMCTIYDVQTFDCFSPFFSLWETTTSSTITTTDVFRGPFLLNFAPFCLFWEMQLFATLNRT